MRSSSHSRSQLRSIGIARAAVRRLPPFHLLLLLWSSGCASSHDFTPPPPAPTTACTEVGLESFERIAIEFAPLPSPAPTGWDGLESMNLRTPYLFDSGVYLPAVNPIPGWLDIAPVVRVECTEPLGVDWQEREACDVGREPYVPHGTAHLWLRYLPDPRKHVEFRLPCLAREVSIRAFNWSPPFPLGIVGLDAEGNVVAPGDPVPLSTSFEEGLVQTETPGGEAAIARVAFVTDPEWVESASPMIIDQLEWR